MPRFGFVGAEPDVPQGLAWTVVDPNVRAARNAAKAKAASDAANDAKRRWTQAQAINQAGGNTVIAAQQAVIAAAKAARDAASDRVRAAAQAIGDTNANQDAATTPAAANSGDSLTTLLLVAGLVFALSDDNRRR